ncbi:MAG: metalloprotease TldD, partial [Acetobacter sp.]|nr:metalloprotease TldD [Acetobacter sp.]
MSSAPTASAFLSGITEENALTVTDRLFWQNPDAKLALDDASQITGQTLDGMDDGELFLEYRETEGISLEDGVIRSAAFDTTTGFGLRSILGEESGFAHSDEISEKALRRASETVKTIRNGRSGVQAPPPRPTNARLYTGANPMEGTDFARRSSVLQEIDAWVRAQDSRVVQVMASLSSSWQAVQIIRADGGRVADLRPLVRLNINVVVEKDGRRESSSYGLGGRYDVARLLEQETWKHAASEALRTALVTLDAQPAPAGEMEVVLGAGWPGILLHEAVGHGLEGDFNRKGTSAFAGLIGKRVASPG